MLLLSLVPLLLLVTFILILSVATLHRGKHGQSSPPGPRGLPVIGNLHMLGKLPHRSLQALAKRYGPIMSLRLGQVLTIVVSTSDAAEHFLKTHNSVFLSRPRTQASNFLAYGSKGLVFSEYGPYWRNMRKLCTLQLLTASKVESFAPLRRRELMLAVKSLQKAATAREVVDLSEVVHSLSEDIVYKMVLGCSKIDEFDLKGLIQQYMHLLGAFNIADFVPRLGAFDLQGLKRSFKETSKALDQVLEKIIQEHERCLDVQNDQHHKDLTDVLLYEIHKSTDTEDDLDRTNIKAVLVDIIAASFETSSTVVEWGLAELLRNPRVMKNLQDELDNVIGPNKLVEEDDLTKLNYLDMVIKETLRLYPPGPLLPRESIEDVMVYDYFIEKKSRIIVNLWAIGRDPEAWSDNAEEFYPERFMDNNVNFRGGNDNFHFIPFGYGRRGCPGMNLGLATVKLVVAQLVHCFRWELPSHTAPNDLDMSEKSGFAIPRAKNLLVAPTYRL